MSQIFFSFFFIFTNKFNFQLGNFSTNQNQMSNKKRKREKVQKREEEEVEVILKENKKIKLDHEEDLKKIINLITPKQRERSTTKQVLNEVTEFVKELNRKYGACLYGSWNCGLALHEHSDIDISKRSPSKIFIFLILSLEVESSTNNNNILKKIFYHFKRNSNFILNFLFFMINS